MADREIIAAEASLPTARSAALRPASLENRLELLRGIASQAALWRAMPALAGVGALGLAGLAWWGLQSPTQRPLFEGLGEAEKSAVADALQSGNIAYRIDPDTGAITVGEDDVHRARMMLAGQGLPKAAPSGASIVSSLPMGSSRAVEGETLRGAREADLARTIEAIDAVKIARVHLATPEPSVFVRDDTAPAASVMLTLQNGRALSESQVRAIKHLVAASVPGLAPDQVSVVDQSGALISQPDSNSDNQTFQLQLQMEERFRQALTALLAPMAGPGNFTAEVHVDIDPSESQSTRESYPKDDQALISEQGTKTTGGAGQIPPAIGVPGALSNQPPPASQLSTQPSSAIGTTPAQAAAPTQSEENFSRRFDVGREISVTHQPVGRVRRLSVAVALRDAKGGKPRSQAELAALENLVKGAVGFDPARGDVVAISSRPFADSDAAPPAFWEAPWFLPLVRQAGAVLVALLVLLFVGRPLVKAIKARAEAPRAPTASRRAPSVDGGQITLEMIESAPSYAARADLVRDFVRQDPQRASLAVRQMMREGANG